MNVNNKGYGKLTALVGRLKDGLKRAFTLGPGAWKSAAYVLLATSAVVWFGTFIGSAPGSLHGWLVNLSFVILIGVLSLLLGQLIVLLLAQFQKIPKFYRWVFVGTLFLFFNLLKPSILLIINVIGVLLFLVAASSFVGVAIGALKEGRLESVNRRVAVGMLILGGLGLITAASYSLQFPQGFALDPQESGALTFAVANASQEQEPLDFTIVITDRAGEEAALSLSSISPLPPVLQYQMFKPPLQVVFKSEPVYTTYTLQLDHFLAANGAVDPSNLEQVSFVFDRSPQGEIFLDDVGFPE